MELVNESFTSSYSGSSIVHSLQSRITSTLAQVPRCQRQAPLPRKPIWMTELAPERALPRATRCPGNRAPHCENLSALCLELLGVLGIERLIARTGVDGGGESAQAHQGSRGEGIGVCLELLGVLGIERLIARTSMDSGGESAQAHQGSRGEGIGVTGLGKLAR